ncbi:F0F1 ATP synthase subunit delta [Sulfitobacter sp. R18_1]|uniref:F0F1 ATP synthase subunit delta n=1 Tax=Sulfitobacter sp. R18_1 TaxID=2821104 RepID=UPI001ADCDEBF|nr:F0F1 ATP synthase subunit delta [Sulfitobacter sp. R18_1]
MSEPASISTGIAERYATAVYDLAREANQVDAIEGDLTALEAALNDSDDFRRLTTSPLYTREEQEQAIKVLAEKMGLTKAMANTLQLMAQKRRLFALPALVKALRETIAEAKGEITAEVTTAKALTKAQSDKLAKSLTASTGKKVSLHATVDESLIGGLVVKVGSKMIDTSIRSKLNSLQNVMKEVG